MSGDTQCNSRREIIIKVFDEAKIACRLVDLKVPPSNRLEKLSGDLNEYNSIRINDQWSIIFKWQENNAAEVQILDYH